MVEITSRQSANMPANPKNSQILNSPENSESELVIAIREPSYPFLDVREPENNDYTICLKKFFEQNPEQTSITIGRGHDNDIILLDPYKKVSRQHCSIERDGDRWWLSDQGSANGTFLRQEGCSGSEVDVRSVGTILLHDGDVILILGKLTAAQEPKFWQLTFHDPNLTDQVEGFQPPAKLEYDFNGQKLLQVNRQLRSEIKLSPQEHNLIHYMAQCNRENDNQPAVCGHQDLIKAIWEEPFNHTPNEVTHLVWSLREKIERDSGEPQFLKTVWGQGYLLNIKIH
jgi:DNA-binding winged helix-turn-helix (wHTH) protein